jgi:preprotein translocase subunit SecE
MSRVTELTEKEEELAEEEEHLSEEPVRGGGGDDGGESRIKLPKLSIFGRVGEFYQQVKQEMRKTTWPTRTEVWSTTVVVLLAVVFFGFYLWGVDRLVTLGFEALERAIR